MTTTFGPAETWQIQFEYDSDDRAQFMTAELGEFDPVVVPIPEPLEADAQVLQWLVHQVLVDALQQAQTWQAQSSLRGPSGQSSQLSPSSQDFDQAQIVAELTQLRAAHAELQQHRQAQADQIEQLKADKLFLEQTLRQIPIIYRRKFDERLQPVRERIQRLQDENQRLREQVQQLSESTPTPTLEEIDPTAPAIWPLLSFGKGSNLSPVAS